MTKPKRSTSRRPATRFRVYALLLAASIIFSGCGDCLSGVGRDAAKELTGSVNKIVEDLPGILAQIDKTIADNIGKVDDTMAHQIQEVNKLLKENVDGINAALQESIDNVDAMLAARLDQIFKFANGFLKELDGIFQKRINQLSYNLQTLIKTTEVSGSELLETAGFQVVKTIREGNQVVAVVVGGVIETVIIAGAIVVILLVTVFGGIFFWRQRRRQKGDEGKLENWQLGLGSGFFGLIVVIAALMIFVPSVRASVASGRVPLSRNDECVDAVPLGAVFVADHRGATAGSLDQPATEQGTQLLATLYQCLAEGSVADLRSKAREYSAEIERMIGASTRCRRDEQCSTALGEHCQLATGLCTTRCDGPQHCKAGDVCHSPDTIGLCGPRCDAANPCAAGLTCNAGECSPTETAPPTGGGGGHHFIPGGVLDDIVLRSNMGCPGARCPIRVCVACAWTDPTPEERPTERTVEPGVFHEAVPVDNTKVRSLDRFYDPRLRPGAAKRNPAAVHR